MDLDAIEAAEKAMTPGPWERDYGGTVGHIKSVANRDDGSTPTVLQYDVRTPSLTLEDRIANAEGIALLRNAAPEMIRRIREQDAEIRRLRQFVADSGSTCYPCETCGHGRTTRECIWCERDRLQSAVHELEEMVSESECRANERGNTIHRLRELCGEANDLIEWDYGGTGDSPRNSIKLRLEAAQKGGES